jgi:metal-responsive CopG/Arc/MetJ family transcriptional regulator
MGVRKITVSLPPDLADSVDVDAEAKGQTVSSWIADAVARKLRRKSARELLRRFETANGPITDAERAEARKLWPD